MLEVELTSSIDRGNLITLSHINVPAKDLECYRKLGAVLTKMCYQVLKTSDDTVLEKLMDLIRSLGMRSRADTEILLPILCDWLKKIGDNWSSLNGVSKTFALKVATFVVSTTSGYQSLSSNGSLATILSHFHRPKAIENCSINLSYIDLMITLLNNGKGIHELAQPEFWEVIVTLALSTSNIYCSRQSTKLIAILIKLSDDSTSKMIVSKVADTIHSTSRTTDDIFNVQNDHSNSNTGIDERQKAVCLSTLRGVFIELMDANYPADKLRFSINSCNLSTSLEALTKSSNRREVLVEATKLRAVINSLTLYQAKDINGLMPVDVASSFTNDVLEHIDELIRRRLVNFIGDACVEYQTLVHKFGSPVAGFQAIDSNGKLNENISSSVYNLLFLIQAVPMLMGLKARSPTFSSDVLEVYFDNLSRKTDSNVMRYLYKFRRAFSLHGEDLGVLSADAVKRFTLLCPIMRREQGIMIFQAVVHVLSEFVVTCTKDCNSHTSTTKSTFIKGDELIAKYPGFLSSCLTCVHTYLTRFDFSWRDSLESLCLLAILQHLLKSPVVPPRITVDILKTIDLVLMKFMPPNLALLIDTLKGSSIEELGPQLFKLLHSVDWAVRDSTLELVKTISSLSESRFPAFQMMLVDNRLPEIVFSLIESDFDPFVRATAISCLCEMARVTNVWKASFTDDVVLEKLLLTMHYETEGIVRVSAAKTITAMYTTCNLSTRALKLIYDTMSHAAQNDLHWEVKTACLDFWREVIAKTAASQGVMDGVFPEAVFSKEKKKIVKMTPEEIRSRVDALMSALESNGCLQVLWGTFDNEPDLEVQRKSAFLLNKIKIGPKLMSWTPEEWNRYKKLAAEKNVTDDNNQQLSASLEAGNERSSEVARDEKSVINLNEIIEQIVAEDDLGLLSGLVNESTDTKSLPPIKRMRMSHTEFNDKLQSIDVDQILLEKTEWLIDSSEGVDSLLNDILLFSNKIDVDSGSSNTNSIDCY